MILGQSSLKAVSQQLRDYNITHLDVTAGLSNNYINDIVEDDFGFKWIATEGGLNKYDGKSFEVFKPSNTPELANENIEVVHKDSQGNLWIGTKSGGLTFFDRKTEKFHEYNSWVFGKNNRSDIRVTCIAEDKKQRIYIGTWNNGVYIFDSNNPENVEKHLKDRRIHQIVKDGNGNMWIGETDNLFKYDLNKNKLTKEGSFGSTSLLFDQIRNRLWVGLASGLHYLDLKDHTLKETDLSKKTFNIASMSMDKEGHLLVGTWGNGLYVSDNSGQAFERVPLKTSPTTRNTSHKAILGIHIDKNDIIWISVAFEGILKLTPVNRFLSSNEFIQSTSSLTDNNMYALYSDSEDKLWIGSYGDGVFIVDRNKHISRSVAPVTKVNAFLELENNMLIGAREGLFISEKNRPDKKVRQVLEDLTKITSLYASKKGDLWIGTQQQGLLRITDFKSAQKKIKASQIERWIDNERISKVVEDEFGNIWIASFKGLYVFTTETNTPKKLSIHLPSSIINDMYVDDTETLWLALSGGLIELNIQQDSDIESVILHGADQGLKNDFVTSVIKGDDDNIWVGTANGIAKYVPEHNVFENYVHSDGVPSLSFNLKCVSNLNDGKMIFGASDGLVAFEPSEIVYRQPAPMVMYNTLKVNGEPVKVSKAYNNQVILPASLQFVDHISLNHRHKTIAFSISIIDYFGDDNVFFSYRLRGLDDLWSPLTNNRDLRFINLSPGKYELEVKASRDNFHWGPIATKKITIHPPFWFRWYAFLLYALLGVFLTYIITRVSKKQSKLRTSLEIEKIAREKEQELAEAKLKFFTNISHEFRTPLTLILSPIEELLTSSDLSKKVRDRLVVMQRNANRMLNLINQLLDFRKSENGLLKLRMATGNFVQFAKEIYLSFVGHAKSRNITYLLRSEDPEINLPYDRDKMEIVIVNLLSNAFKQVDDGGKIEVIITRKVNDCILEIRDNGPGIQEQHVGKIFERFYQIPSNDSQIQFGSGIGLSLSRNIVELHHGDISVSSKPNKETIFQIKLQIDNTSLEVSDFIEDFKSSDDFEAYSKLSETKQSIENSNQGADSNEKYSILVVDDNVEILEYLSLLLTDEGYKTMKAHDGLQALDIAKLELPDLIVSDVMMPKLDGISLCSQIKSDINTSHIPIILLTARTSNVYEVDGLQTGADDYIKKPFNPSIVKTRIKGILENREKLREYFHKLRFEPATEDVNGLDYEEDFIQKTVSIIEDHIHDPNLGIEMLTDQLAMSQSTLYRKLKTLTGLSITAFIRSIRLKRAASLILTQKGMKLNQIAYEVGFNDYKYFKINFQEQYGCLPSNYLKEKGTVKTED